MKRTLLISTLLLASPFSIANEEEQKIEYNIISKENICFSTTIEKEKNIDHVKAELISCDDKNIKYQEAMKDEKTEFIIINGSLRSSKATNGKTYVIDVDAIFYNIKEGKCYNITIDNKATSVDCRSEL